MPESQFPPVIQQAPFFDRALMLGGGVVSCLMFIQLGGIVGTILVGLQLAIGLAMLLASPQRTFAVLATWWPLLLVPLFATASVLWSSAPQVSLRYGAQLLFTALIAVFLASRLPASSLLRIAFWSGLVFLVGCILYPREGMSAQGPVLIGLAGSKNQIGFAAQMFLAAAIVILLRTATPPFERVAALVAAPLAFYLLYQSNAVTPLLLFAISVPMLIVLLALQRGAPIARLTAMLALLVLVLPLVAVGSELNSATESFFINQLGKDATLTGRTLLWDKAFEFIEQRPVLGHGYQALWLGDSADAMGLREWTGMPDGRAFNFHNTFLQLATDLGYAGVAIFIFALVASSVRWIGRYVSAPTSASTFLFALFLLICSRMHTEVILAPFSAATFYFFLCVRAAFVGEPVADGAALRSSSHQAARRLERRSIGRRGGPIS